MPDLGPCIEGPGWPVGEGYKQVRKDGRDQYVHRLAWEEAYGPIPVGMLVCHKCDNPPCCRIDHLFLGTHKDNMADRAAKGRARGGRLRGDQHGKSRLTEEQAVCAMARLLVGESQMSIARSFEVHPSTICKLWAGKAWGWLFTEPDANAQLKGETNHGNDRN